MIFDKATWHGPVPNKYPGGMGTVQGLVLHVMESQDNGTLPPHHSVDTIEGCDSWFHESASQVSAHFGTGTQGELWQWVDTADGAWAIVGRTARGSRSRTRGLSGDSLLESQLDSVAEVLAWLNTTSRCLRWSINELAFDTKRSRLARDGGRRHGEATPSCPGQPILNQRSVIIAKAHAILTGGTDVQLPVYKLGQQEGGSARYREP